MNLLVNESVDRSIERLRRDGHDVVYVAELSPSISDDQVLQRLSNATKVQIVRSSVPGPSPGIAQSVHCDFTGEAVRIRHPS